MPFRLLTLAACLALAGCSSADEVAEELRTDQAATATARAETAGDARKTEEENELFSFAYAWPEQVGAIPALARQLDQRAAQVKAELAQTTRTEKAEFADEQIEIRPHSYGMEWEVVADTPRFLSLSGNFATYSGGAHGMYGLESLVWDKQSKAGMDGVALFQSAEALDEALGQKLCDALDAERAKRRGEAVPADAGDDATGFNSCQHVKDATVLVGSSGGGKFDRIGVWFGPYVAGPYAEGSYELNFPVDAAVIEAVKPEYREAFAAK